MSNFRFYFIDEDGEVTGHNSPELAEKVNQNWDNWLVIDTQTGKTPCGRYEVEEFKQHTPDAIT